MMVSEQGRSELVKVADEIAYNVEDRERLIDSFMDIVDKYEIPKNVARRVLQDALKKKGLAEWTIRRALPDELKQKQVKTDKSLVIGEQIAQDSTEESSEESEVTNNEPEPEPEPQEEVVEAVAEEMILKKQEREKIENEMTELCQRVEILTNDNRELKKALADRTAFQAASQITPNEDLVNRAKSAEQQVRELTEEIEALKQQKTLQLQPQPLELEIDTFYDTIVTLFLPKNRGKALKIIHDGSRVQQITIWKSDKGVRASK